MKVGLFSDIHLEHRGNDEAGAIMKRLIEGMDGCDLAINAGDTHHSFDVQMAVARGVISGLPLSKVSPYVVVGGNHDSYGSPFPVEDDVVVQTFDGIKLLSGTMWTNFDENPLCVEDSQRIISDFRWISPCSPDDMAGKFYHFLSRVEEEKPDVVVSHFAPSPESIVEKWRGHPLNSYFCPNALGRLQHWPRLWLHGHIHDPVDYEVESVDQRCRVVANPLGYPRETYKKVRDYSVKVIEI